MLALRGIEKAFGRGARARTVLAGVSLEVAAGETVLLVGRNGAGKTTLLRIATGFLDADAGDVTVDGIALAGDRTTAQARIGYLPELAPVPGDLVVRDHLVLRARLKGVARADVDGAVARAAALAALDSVLGRRIGNLSKGFRQRVGLADALLGDPRVLILDEPTSGLDPIQVTELRAHLVVIAASRAVLVSSHAVADLRTLATRVAILRDGVLVALATPAELETRTGQGRLEDAVLALLEPAP